MKYTLMLLLTLLTKNHNVLILFQNNYVNIFCVCRDDKNLFAARGFYQRMLYFSSGKLWPEKTQLKTSATPPDPTNTIRIKKVPNEG